MIRAALLAFFLLPLGCTVKSLPGSESNRLGAGDGGTIVDLGPGGHDDGGCGGSVDLAGGWWGDGGGSVDLAGGWWSDGGVGIDAWFFDLGYGADGGPHDGGPHVDLAH
jgi:hypothetical protein